MSKDKIHKKKILADYERHLIPISWSDFPLTYIEELRDLELHYEVQFRRLGFRLSLDWNTYWKRNGCTKFFKDPDWKRACTIPAFHYGIRLSHDEVIKFGEQCWRIMSPKATFKAKEHTMPVTFILNERLAEGGHADIKFIWAQPVGPARGESFICSLITTNEPDTWMSPEKLQFALSVIRKEFQLTDDHEPMWYFDYDFFGPHNFDYAEFDADRVVGSGFLERFPEHVQTAIKEGTEVLWSTKPPYHSALSDRIAATTLDDQ
ncbi:hypothetical protein L226DRAFT_562333 [Lentinus tigrinus ALCF2SS1-7]|uniref:Uncharacterized protein n=1 Tax=Lentinus tigrinus ALCF2SS1-6 TaxID=1328759 RepID=A0A5C2RZH3_9APHY|nr:hypothetical protein L227DRAFT_603019 [Lentinus tigrinus ALCF2SS1-6]RPD71487.1 hypothetical protein L226DRAFT_562333 [Lentinus tigrinus ALCF2SS1-7]